MSKRKRKRNSGVTLVDCTSQINRILSAINVLGDRENVRVTLRSPTSAVQVGQYFPSNLPDLAMMSAKLATAISQTEPSLAGVLVVRHERSPGRATVYGAIMFDGNVRCVPADELAESYPEEIIAEEGLTFAEFSDLLNRAAGESN